MKKRVQSELSKLSDKSIILEKPRDRQFGHYATPIAFSLAKELRRSPMQIADELAKSFESSSIFEKVEPIKGYVNFKLSESFLDEYATWALKNESEFGKDEQGETILLEFVSANPTGPLHIGHARGAVLGEALSRLGKHLGNEIVKEYYINDAGNQIYLLGLSIYLAAKEELGQEVQWPQEYYRGDYIKDLAKEAIEEFGKEAFSDESLIDKLSEWGKEKMMELIVSNLAAVDIKFDHFVSEKALYEKWDEVFAILKEHDAVYEKDSKVWLKSSEYGDEKDRVVVREDGRPTYLAGDIIYHYDKFKRGFDRYINIWGADHHGYIARVKAAIKFLGFDPDKLEVLLAQMVSLLKGGEPYKMSKRAGNFILMSEVVEEIGADALKFMFLSKKADTHLEFDVDMLKKEDASNPVYYINYAHARINSVLEKAGKSAGEVIDTPLKDLNEDAKDLLFEALILPEIIEDAFAKRELQRLTDYLKALAAQFHSFYNKHKVIGSEYEDRYLKLFLVVALSIRVGLRLLGIEAKKRM
ncbi:arginine--tRNA ligase [Nitratiruptor sp. SB155-2]|uniref:Arginine--tRNA ligase n=1 Tax=Nitratiruptor sp. (strain SB155-2) TaxID=387092 RepID=SYR_NITSB|nr:arginine--tRNA ligase [Nitratiruptor sp. SB155-2]A6Q543.1 RecName: Full=Arginine--tRNA ligase; AltName: Full=Arginyl-tRNA synthetase; Short=ArgRS [Nitratiruptor sp. SB155-2]BAF70602.1 arginyl-tRNA synthetase [Nitratiruptor sp. SB155-2]